MLMSVNSNRRASWALESIKGVRADTLIFVSKASDMLNASERFQKPSPKMRRQGEKLPLLKGD